MSRLTKSQNILEGPILSGIIAYTIPIILTNLLQLLFNAADLVVVGRYCGSASVGAVGATGSLTHLLTNFFIGLSVGTGVVVAQGIGAQNNRQVHRSVHTALPTAIICGVILTVLGVLFCEDLLRMMDTPGDILHLSSVYMKIYFSGITFVLLYNFAASILRAAGDTKTPFAALGISGVVNVILNVIFVTVFDMNVAGVALATIISQALSAFLVMVALLRREDSCRFCFRCLCMDKDSLKKIFKIGIPAGIQSSLFNISNVTIQSSVNSFGAEVISGNAAASNIEGFVYMTMNAFSQTSLNFAGQNMGAKNFQRIRKIMWCCLATVFAVGAVFGSISYIFGRNLLSIYITDSSAAIEAGMVRLSLICLPYALAGVMEVVSGGLRGIGSSIAPMVISILFVCVFRVVWVYTIFSVIRTPQCLFFSYSISWIATFAVELIIFIILLRKKERLHSS